VRDGQARVRADAAACRGERNINQLDVEVKKKKDAFDVGRNKPNI